MGRQLEDGWDVSFFHRNQLIDRLSILHGNGTAEEEEDSLSSSSSDQMQGDPEVESIGGWVYHSDDDSNILGPPAPPPDDDDSDPMLPGGNISPPPADDEEESLAPYDPLSPLPAQPQGRPPNYYRQLQQRREELLSISLPLAHSGRLEVTSFRFCGERARHFPCDVCKTIGNDLLWSCCECHIVANQTHVVCTNCFLKAHVNKLHTCLVWREGEKFLRPPRGDDETLIFQLRPVCTACGRVSPYEAPNCQMRRLHVLLPSGVFICNSLASCINCPGCIQNTIETPTAASFGCTQSSAEHGANPAIWISGMLMQLVMSLRCKT